MLHSNLASLRNKRRNRQGQVASQIAEQLFGFVVAGAGIAIAARLLDCAFAGAKCIVKGWLVAEQAAAQFASVIVARRKLKIFLVAEPMFLRSKGTDCAVHRKIGHQGSRSAASSFFLVPKRPDWSI